MPASFKIPTVKVKDGVGGFTRINASDFSDAIHELYVEPAAEAPEDLSAGPVELPGFDLSALTPRVRTGLEAAGLSTALALVTAAAEDAAWYERVDGVGPAIAEQIITEALSYVVEE